MKNRVITISREFGSGGRTIGKKVAEKLGIPCYDSELIQKIAEESGFAENYVKEAGEYVPGGFLSSVLANRAFGPTNEDILWETQCRVIMELAEKGPCVIVGRCADYILRNRDDVVRVFIMGDMPTRIKTIMARKNLSEDQAKKLIKEVDKDRSSYYRYYTDQIWGEAENYDLCIDSGRIGVQGVVDVIKAYIAARK